MAYMICRRTKEQLQEEIKHMIKVHCEESDFPNHYISKNTALETILYFSFCSEGWNETDDCPATHFTNSDRYGIRYHLYSPSNQDVIYNPLKKEEAFAICEKILEGMVEQKLAIVSKSGKGVKYIGD